MRARAKYVRSSARKARLVMDHVRGRSVADARALLRHSPRGVARDVERLLNSAVANAENNHDLVGDDLYVKEIYADEGPTLRRFRPRAQGRATRIRKRTSHLTVGLSTRSELDADAEKVTDGTEVHPEGFRVGYIHDWKSNWFNEREFADYLLEDIKIREHIEGKLGHAGLSDIRIRKDKNEVTVDIHTARPGHRDRQVRQPRSTRCAVTCTR